MLLLIAILLAAILITLLGAWGYVPRTLAVIVGIVLWVFLAGVTGAAFGEWGVWMVLALPFVMAAGFGIVEFARGNIDEIRDLYAKTENSHQGSERRSGPAAPPVTGPRPFG